jgi:hypothetical protein
MVSYLIGSMKRKFTSYQNSPVSMKMIAFNKNANCPASQDLLAFQKGETTLAENTEILRHLESCEFCAAEIDFYTHVALNEETVASVEIPLPLFQLAEALLSSGQKKFSMLNKLLNKA